jgi:hypothetical protein
MRLFALLVSLLTTSLILSCKTTSEHWPSSGTYRGIHEFGFERCDFIPENSKERWSLSGDIMELHRRMTRPARFNEIALASPVFIVVEGELSKPGHYGHNGGCRRELVVTRVLEVTQAVSTSR